MFKSKKRQINIPQSEHVKIAATIALLWGNESFQKPNIPTHSFVKGVLFHDRGYKDYDNFPVGSLTKKQRRDTLKKGILKDSGDIIADIVSLHHINRLIPEDMSDIRQILEKFLSNKMKKVVISPKEFLFADRITDFADEIAFYFSFEEDTRGSSEVLSNHSSNKIEKIEFNIKDNCITMSPWPLSVDYHEGFIVGYQRKGYPKKLSPEIIPFILKKAK
ncbi:DUF3891 family protein [Candidatus Pacearchaeota archaeon]|nr:DUF3891 family protein [Candidatus Pacearchaeota archaeon]